MVHNDFVRVIKRPPQKKHVFLRCAKRSGYRLSLASLGVSSEDGTQPRNANLCSAD